MAARPLNATSGFPLVDAIVFEKSKSISIPNFVQIGAFIPVTWRHIYFSTWRPRPLNTTSGFVFVDVTAFRMSKSISKPKFRRHISIGGWDITTSVFEKQTYAISNSTPGFDLDHFPVICMLFCIRYRISSESEHPGQKDDVISISQDGGRDR